MLHMHRHELLAIQSNVLRRGYYEDASIATAGRPLGG